MPDSSSYADFGAEATWLAYGRGVVNAGEVVRGARWLRWVGEE